MGRVEVVAATDGDPTQFLLHPPRTSPSPETAWDGLVPIGANGAPPSEPQPEAAAMGALSGVVVDVRLSQGSISIRTDEVVEVRATPTQIAALVRGMAITARYVQYGDALWLVGHYGLSSCGPFTISGEVAGTIYDLDKAGGEITLAFGSQRRRFRTHPDDTRGLLPGHAVIVSYHRIGRLDWVACLAPFETVPPKPPSAGGLPPDQDREADQAGARLLRPVGPGCNCPVP
jgi:hypothetical protein